MIGVLIQTDKKMTHCPYTRAKVVMITKLGRKALCFYSVITVVMGCIPFFKRAEMAEEDELEKNICQMFKTW